MRVKNAVLKTLEAVGALVVLTLVILWMSGAFKKKIEPGEISEARQNLPENAKLATIEEEKFTLTEEASGTVEAKRRTAVSSRIMATIREVKVSAGDEVSQGETLIVLDDRDLSARAQQAERAVEAAQAALQKSEADYNRLKELLARNVIGRSEYDAAESAYKVAQASLGAAQQAKEEADVAFSFAAITAPVSGRIVERYAEPGDTASPGQPLLSIYDPQSLRVEAPVRESVLNYVKVGAEIQVRVGDAEGMIKGKVGEIVPEAEVGSRTFLVKVDMPSSENIYTGMFARIQIPAGEQTRLVVNQKAIETIGQLNFVMVVAEDRTTSRRLVTIGTETVGGKVEVLSGLSPGERVLLHEI